MSGGEAHVENSIWMRAVLIGGVFLAIGILAFATMGVGAANLKHHDYEIAMSEYEEAKYAYEDAKATNASADEIATLKEAKEAAHHHEVEAHLSYLTWKTAGITILLMCITYAAFIGLGGFLNSIAPNEDDAHDNHGYGGDDHEHHGSGSPSSSHSESCSSSWASHRSKAYWATCCPVQTSFLVTLESACSAS